MNLSRYQFLASSRWAPEEHGGHSISVEHARKKLSGAEEVLLAYEFLEG